MPVVAPAEDPSSAAGGPLLRLLIFPVRTLVDDLLSLEKNAEELYLTIEYLGAMRSDVESAVRGNGILLRQSAREWMDSADALSDEVSRLLAALDRIGCLWSWSYFKLGRDIAEKLRQVRLLVSRRRNLGVLVGAALSEYPSVLVGMERTLSQITGHLSADDVRVVGITGMGGSGKTRLLKRINNELLAAGEGCPFDALVWVTVSQEPDVRRIQDAIGTQLRLHLSPSWADSSDGERARILFRALKRWKFLLMLDDLWEPLDFEAIGIPHPTGERDSTIAVTTRSLQVCIDMGADVKASMDPVLDLDAWKLFDASVGTNVNLVNPLIRQQSMRILRMCGTLPLSLVVVGQAMADTKGPDEWELTASQFEESAEGFRHMDRVLSSLKLSYDRLPDETLRQCLSYCCLFERKCIPLEELVDYWVGEGLLDDPIFSGNMDALRNRAHFVVERLKSASLLEISENYYGEMFVEVHKSIRKMVMKICSGGEQHSLLLKPYSVPRLVWSSDVVRIAVARTDRVEENLKSHFPLCPNLLSLLINKNTRIHHIPSNFFSWMPLLRVLDLSGSNIRMIPEEIGLLTELRCINLSETNIRTLPACIGRLVKLGKLLLTRTWELETIPRRAILCLTSLEKLDIYQSHYRWPEESDEERVSLKDLSLLPGLSDLRLNVLSLPILVEILRSASLSRATRYLTLQGIEDLSQLPLIFNAMNNLQQLNIGKCSGLQELTFNSGELCSLEAMSFEHLSMTKIVIPETSLRLLKQLKISGCETLKDLTSVHKLPHLECIDLCFCSGLEVLIFSAVDDDTQIFPQLKKIILKFLPKFKCIYHRSLLLPRIESLEVFGCPMLMKLPLDAYSACCIKQIVAERGWWDTLQWDEDRTKMKFHPFLKDQWQEEKERVREQQKALFRLTEDYCLPSALLEVFPGAWTAALLSLDNVGIWNVRAENLDTWYLGQETYIRVVNPEQTNKTELAPADNVLYCGRLQSRQKPQAIHHKASAPAIAHGSSNLFTSLLLFIATAIFL